MPFINAYSSATGHKHRVPAHWLDHPKLRKGLRKTPLQRAADTQRAASTPDPAPIDGDTTMKEK